MSDRFRESANRMKDARSASVRAEIVETGVQEPDLISAASLSTVFDLCMTGVCPGIRFTSRFVNFREKFRCIGIDSNSDTGVGAGAIGDCGGVMNSPDCEMTLSLRQNVGISGSCLLYAE